MYNSFEIGEIKIGLDYDPVVIPEMGINHEGSLAVAKLIVDSAKCVGAKIIKHQTHVVDDEMCSAAKKVIPGNSSDSIYDIMKRCALSEEEEFELKNYVESQGMIFLSTPFSRAAADRLNRFGVLAYKIGSGELNNYPLIKHICEFKKPIILSTGMNNISNVKKAVAIINEFNIPFALMHTTNLYPTKPELVRLGAMQELSEAFKGVPYGLSDHTLNNTACVAAMTLGASIVERHFIDKKDRPGPDVVCSMDERELKELIISANSIKKMLGGHKEAMIEEQVTIDFAFASCVTINKIKKGEKFTENNLWVKRPGINGIPAEKYNDILGKTAIKDIMNNVQIDWSMIGD